MSSFFLGCSKKKVQDILLMRPYEGWMDLVTKVQDNRNLSTEMLNNTTHLLKMRDAVKRLMDKCAKITEKMTKMVEDLTNSDDNKGLEITEQPKCIPDGKNQYFSSIFYFFFALVEENFKLKSKIIPFMNLIEKIIL